MNTNPLPVELRVVTKLQQSHLTLLSPLQLKLTFGWRVYITNTPTERLSFAEAVFTYRDEWIAERRFHRFKGIFLSGITRTVSDLVQWNP